MSRHYDNVPMKQILSQLRREFVSANPEITPTTGNILKWLKDRAETAEEASAKKGDMLRLSTLNDGESANYVDDDGVDWASEDTWKVSPQLSRLSEAKSGLLVELDDVSKTLAKNTKDLISFGSAVADMASAPKPRRAPKRTPNLPPEPEVTKAPSWATKKPRKAKVVTSEWPEHYPASLEDVPPVRSTS